MTESPKRKPRGLTALGVTAIFAAGYLTNQASRPPDCHTLDEELFQPVHLLARDYAKVAKAGISYIHDSGNPDARLYFSAPGFTSPEEITDNTLDELKNIFDRSAELGRANSRIKTDTQCALNRSEGLRHYITGEARSLLDKIKAAMQLAPESFQHLEKHRPARSPWPMPTAPQIQPSKDLIV